MSFAFFPALLDPLIINQTGLTIPASTTVPIGPGATIVRNSGRVSYNRTTGFFAGGAGVYMLAGVPLAPGYAQLTYAQWFFSMSAGTLAWIWDDVGRTGLGTLSHMPAIISRAAAPFSGVDLLLFCTIAATGTIPTLLLCQIA